MNVVAVQCRQDITQPRVILQPVVLAIDDHILELTLRIRRRRAQDVADTTDSLRAVACIRFGVPSMGAVLMGFKSPV